MKIGFDAKRAFNNGTGLGHYSRTLVTSLSEFFPENQYYLFTPKQTDLFNINKLQNVRVSLPHGIANRVFSAAWRSSWVKRDLLNMNIDLYHGLSHEIPIGIKKTGVKSVVTIHDLIFERYPKQYKPIDVQIYRRKFKYACQNADRIIAISNQTRDDIIEFYGIDERRISVCYQSCNEAFATRVDEEQKLRIRKLYNLPVEFFLYVGSVIERKNLLSVCKALTRVRHLRIPLVVIGEGSDYMMQVKDFVKANQLDHKVIFLSEQKRTRNLPSFRQAIDFPAIYQQALCMIYPSIFEGFGIPVLEAMWSGLPVITSNVSCLPETGGDAAMLVDPFNIKELADAMEKVATNELHRKTMIEKGFKHAQNFTQLKCASSVMDVYRQVTD